MSGVSPEVVSTVRAIFLVLACLAGVLPSAVQIIRHNRKG